MVTLYYRAYVNRVVHRITHSQLLHPAFQYLTELFIARGLHQESANAVTDLPCEVALFTRLG